MADAGFFEAAPRFGSDAPMAAARFFKPPRAFFKTVRDGIANTPPPAVFLHSLQSQADWKASANGDSCHVLPSDNHAAELSNLYTQQCYETHYVAVLCIIIIMLIHGAATEITV